LKRSSLPWFSAAAALLTAALLTASIVVQAQQTPTPPSSGQEASAGGPPAQRRPNPAPTNLQVLPKTRTGDQVHEIMEKWEGDLGGHCNTCHAADPKNVGPNGRPRLNFADDAKEEKQTARLMYKMMEDINTNYISKVPSSDQAVTCGTCHRGHLGPEPYKAPEEEHHGPPPGGEPPARARPPAGK
jgi:hypothetical protein